MHITNLRNEELSQFTGQFAHLAEEAGIAVKEPYAAYAALCGKFGKGLEHTGKSRHTEDIAGADRLRDDAYRGFELFVEAFRYSHNPEKQQAARNIRIITDTFGNFRDRPYNEETAIITSFLNKIGADCKADLELIGAGVWIDDLTAANRRFNDLMNVRFDENAAQEYINLRDTRRRLEAAYAELTEVINALLLITKDPALQTLADKHNERVAYYRNTLAQRQGHNRKAKDNGESESELRL